MCQRRQKSLDTPRAIGRIEIPRDAQPEQVPQAHRHVRVAAEIEVQLARVSDERTTRRGGERQRLPLPERRVDVCRDVIGDDDLLGEADQKKEPDPAAHPLLADRPLDPPRSSSICRNRTIGPATSCEKRFTYVGIREVAGRAGPAAANVDDVRDGVERVERNPHRQDDLEMRERAVDAETRGTGAPYPARIRVLEDAQQRRSTGSAITRKALPPPRVDHRRNPRPAKKLTAVENTISALNRIPIAVET